jgi:beta-glucosidase
MSWPVDVGQIPIFYSRLPTGRPRVADFRYSSKYLDMPNEPLFPFGHGLSYTRFRYGNLRASPEVLADGDTLVVTADITNEGPVAGEAAALLFIRDPVASVSRPVLELKGTAKAWLRPGESRAVEFALPRHDLAYLDSGLAPRLDPGVIEVFVGGSAAPEALLKTTVRVAGA